MRKWRLFNEFEFMDKLLFLLQPKTEILAFLYQLYIVISTNFLRHQ